MRIAGGIVDKTDGIKFSEIKSKLQTCFPRYIDPNKIDSYRGLRYYDTDLSDDVLIPAGKVCFSDFNRRQCMPTCTFNKTNVVILQQPQDRAGVTNQTVTFTVRWRVDFPATQPGSCPQVWYEGPTPPDPRPGAFDIIWERKGPGLGSTWEYVIGGTGANYDFEYDYGDFANNTLTLKLKTNQQNYHNHQFRASLISRVYGTYNFDHENDYSKYNEVAVTTETSNNATFTFEFTEPPPHHIINGTWTTTSPLNINYCVAENDYRGGGTWQAAIDNLRVNNPPSVWWTPSYQGMTGEWQYYMAGAWHRFRGDPGGSDYPVDAGITVEYPDVEYNAVTQVTGSGELTSRIREGGHEPWYPSGIFFGTLSHWYDWANNYASNNVSNVRLVVTATTIWTHTVTGETYTRSNDKTFGGTSGLYIGTQEVANCDGELGFEYIRVLDTESGQPITSIVEGQSCILEAKLTEHYWRDGDFTAKDFHDPDSIFDFDNIFSVVFYASGSIGTQPTGAFYKLFGDSNHMSAEVGVDGIARYPFVTSVHPQFTGDTIGAVDGTLGNYAYDTGEIGAICYSYYKISAQPYAPIAIPGSESPKYAMAARNRSAVHQLSSSKQIGGTGYNPGDSSVDEGGEVTFTVTGTNIPRHNGTAAVGGTAIYSFVISGLDTTNILEAGNDQGTFSMTYNSATERYEGSFTVVTRTDPDNFEDHVGTLRIFTDIDRYGLFDLVEAGTGIMSGPVMSIGGVTSYKFRVLNTNVQYTVPTYNDVGIFASFCVPANQVPIEEMFGGATFNGDGSFRTFFAPLNGSNPTIGNWHTGVDDEFSQRLEFFMTAAEIIALNETLQGFTYVNDEAQLDPRFDRGFFVRGRVSVVSGMLTIGLTSDSPANYLGPNTGFHITGSSTYSVLDRETGETTNAVGQIRIELGADNFLDRPCDDNYGNSCPEAGTLARVECRDNSATGGNAYERWEIKYSGNQLANGSCETIETKLNDDHPDCGYTGIGPGTQTDYTNCERYWTDLTEWIAEGNWMAPGAPVQSDYGCTEADLLAFLVERGLIPGGVPTVPAVYGTFVRQYCGTGADSTTSYSVFHDGLGGFYTTTTYNSPLCGYTQYPPAGTFIRFECGNTTSTKFNRYKITANGTGGEISTLHEFNSTECGYQAPVQPDYGTVLYSYCGATPISIDFPALGNWPGVRYTFYEAVADGQGGTFLRETPNSPDCGYQAPPADPDHPPRGERSGRPYCGTGRARYTQYQDYHNGNGGTYTEVVETNSRACGWRPTGTIATKPGGILAVNVTDPGRALLSDYPNTTGARYLGSTGSGAVFDIDTSPNATLTNGGITIVNGGQSYQVGDQFEASSVSFGGQLYGYFEVTQVVEQDDTPPSGPIGDPFCSSVLGEANTFGDFALIELVKLTGFVPEYRVVEQNSPDCGYTDVTTPNHPEAGTASGAQYCGTGSNQYTLYQNYHDGSGGTYTEVIERNSTACGYVEQTDYPDRGTPSGAEYCGTGANQYTLYQKYHDGRGGTYTEVVETNSTTCGYVAPPPPPVHDPKGTPVGAPFCASSLGTYNTYGQYAQLQTYADGNGGYSIEVIDQNSEECGYTPPPAHPVRGTASGGAYCGTGTNQYTRYQNYHDGSGGIYTEVLERNSSECGYTPPAPSHPPAGTAFGEGYCGTGMQRYTLYQDYHDGSGGIYTEVVEFRSTECGFEPPTSTGPDRGGSLGR